ncbi:MAG: hypothetical protein KDK64_03320 [Chlamydiia bacterium]|nr:hypothetical protein [Chlamydiia bacterium]
MSCKVIPSIEGHTTVTLSQSIDSQEAVVSDTQLEEFVASHTPKEVETQHRFYTEQRDSLDLTQVTPEGGLQWLAALPGEIFCVSGEAFPFPSTLDCSKEVLTRLLGEKTGISLEWVTPSDSTLEALFSLIQEGKVIHLKIQGGFSLSGAQFNALKRALSHAEGLESLELLNIRLSEEQMIELSRIIPSLKSLRSLTLVSNGIGKNIVAPFSVMIKSCPSISHIKLTFALFKSIPGLETLATAAAPNQVIDLSENWDFAR